MDWYCIISFFDLKLRSLIKYLNFILNNSFVSPSASISPIGKYFNYNAFFFYIQ